MPDIFCKWCGKSFYIKPSQVGKKKYCCFSCATNGQIKKIKIECANCGDKFYARPCEIKNGRKFCSVKCMGEYSSKHIIKEKHSQWKGGKDIRECPVCNKKFSVFKKSTVTHCSMKCYSTTHTGANSVLWKGGKIKVLCPTCGKEFLIHRAWAKKNKKSFCSRPCSAAYNISHNFNGRTSIELKIEKELIKRDIDFKKQYPIVKARTVPDFFIEPNIVIYADGDYWHRRPGTPEKDSKQNYMLTINGYKVYRFWECEINKDVGKCVDMVVQYIDDKDRV